MYVSTPSEKDAWGHLGRECPTEKGLNCFLCKFEEHETFLVLFATVALASLSCGAAVQGTTLGLEDRVDKCHPMVPLASFSDPTLTS